MIIDAFTFFNEYDILAGRLEYLYNKVDYFVIVEANITHTGKPKTLNYLANIHRYQRFIDKILYFPIAIDSTEFNFNIKPTECDFTAPQWLVENKQRNHIQSALELFDNTATVMISDVDEIPNLITLDNIVAHLSIERPAITLAQDMFYYNLKQKQVNPWAGPVVTTNKYAKEKTPQWFRDNRWALPIASGGGWHFSYWGSPEQIQHKILNFAHQEYNTSVNSNIDTIKQRMAQGQDIYARRDNPFIPVDISTLPVDIVNIFGNIKQNH
jgi:beta-1,4-mannosyl-glycoprotein beta-1,4-N-acetylglucosaminyltransferase